MKIQLQSPFKILKEQSQGMEEKSKKTVSGREIGVVGTENYGGYLTDEDHNTEWQGERAIETAEKMRKEDTQINASLLMMELPILAATHIIEPASDDPEHQKQAEFIENNLFHNRNFNWNNKLRNILRYLQYGFWIFEKTYELIDNKIWLKNLNDRLPGTIRRWIQDPETGQLKEIEQFATTYDGGYQNYLIPNKKMLIFVNDQVGNNWRGESVIRQDWSAYTMKKNMRKIDAIRHDRFGTGVPMVSIPDISNDAEYAAAESVCETYRSHEKQYIIKQDDWNFEIVDHKASSFTDIIGSIARENQEVTSNRLQQFMDLGKTQTGSRAVGHVLAKTFYNGLRANANYIEDVINESLEGRELIKELIDLNFGKVDKYPKYRIQKIETPDLIEYTAAIRNISQAGIELTNEQKDVIYANLRLPLPDYDEIEKEKKEKQKNLPPQIKTDVQDQGQNTDKQKMQDCDHVHTFQEVPNGGFWRELKECEKDCGIEEINEKLSGFRESMITIGNKYRSEMIRGLVAQGIKLLNRNIGFDEFNKKLSLQKVPKMGSMEAELRREFRNIYDYSKRKVKSEFKNQQIKLQEPLSEDEEESRKALKPLAMASVLALSNKLKQEWIKILLNQKRRGITDSVALNEALVKLSNKDFRIDMQSKATEVFGLGREAEAKKHIDEDVKIIHSEIMDLNTCTPCRNVDGNEYKPGDPGLASYNDGQYVNCEGAQLCRGIHIYVRE